MEGLSLWGQSAILRSVAQKGYLRVAYSEENWLFAIQGMNSILHSVR